MTSIFDRRATLTAATASLMICPTPASAKTIRQGRVAIGDWRLDISRDSFSGYVSCRLWQAHRRAIYRGGAVGFRFPSRLSVSAATYRINGGELRRWRDDIPELVALNSPIDSGTMTRPYNGVVWIPWRLLAAANSVTIQPASGVTPRTFHLAGIRGLRATALARGCSPDTRFTQ